MANRKGNNVSRRELMKVLSTGAIGGALGGVAFAESTPVTGVAAPNCNMIAQPQSGNIIKGSTKKAVYADCCCPAARDALRVGVDALKTLKNIGGPHLLPFIDAVDKAGVLDEHCFIVFNLPEAAVPDFKSAVEKLFISK
jgi:hypothetical protein